MIRWCTPSKTFDKISTLLSPLQPRGISKDNNTPYAELGIRAIFCSRECRVTGRFFNIIEGSPLFSFGNSALLEGLQKGQIWSGEVSGRIDIQSARG